MTARVAAVAVAAVLAMGASRAAAAPGKFYVVGTGSAPDLITLRALDVIKRAHIFILEGDGDREFFKEHIGKREVWIAPKSLRIFLGVDPKTLKDPEHRAAAEDLARQRTALIDRITRAVGAGKIVAALQGGREFLAVAFGVKAVRSDEGAVAPFIEDLEHAEVRVAPEQLSKIGVAMREFQIARRARRRARRQQQRQPSRPPAPGDEEISGANEH